MKRVRCFSAANAVLQQTFNFEKTTMPYSAVIFDLDGTLLDTLDDLAETGNQVLEEHGYPVHQPDAYKFFVGEGMQTLVERITPDSATASEKQTCFNRFKTLYSRYWNRRTRPYEGVMQLLALLEKKGFQLGILSNKPHDFTLMCVDYFFPEGTFGQVFGQRPEIPRKPDPAGALEIAGRFGSTPGQCIYIGDTGIDMQTGKSAGMYTIGILWGFRGAAELQDNGADRIAKTPQELAEVINSLSSGNEHA